MEWLEKLYDETEEVKVRFAGFATDTSRYDFGIVFTNMFFGKPLVVCMQTGRSALLDSEDVKNWEYIRKVFHLKSISEAENLASIFEEYVPKHHSVHQYE
ncbi:DUF3055 domain-containing protein [Fictibacillus aquaticus]|uniref:DUF3055 domain-containing protein n=1 Tax=Fictibacillus aquaticus TaxID=2021314 RepID=A0A235FC98_9BACL|nr:DUF3055 domain-containing protein [Fictibacillus aquaticus]OYD59000.1 hypothetical protein CGZ90_03615 [Fictibacillus aquaticus]